MARGHREGLDVRLAAVRAILFFYRVQLRHKGFDLVQQRLAMVGQFQPTAVFLEENSKLGLKVLEVLRQRRLGRVKLQ
jgi:hypothetical protein